MQKWMRARLTENTATNLSINDVISIGIVFSLSVGLIDFALAYSHEISESTFLSLMGPVAATIAFFFIGYIILWFLIVSSLIRLFKLEAVPLSISLAFFIATLFTTSSIDYSIPCSTTIAQFVTLFIMISISIAFSILSYLAARTISDLPGIRYVAIVSSFSMPFLLYELILIRQLFINDYISVLSSFVCYLLLASFTFILFYRIRQRVKSLVLFSVFIIIIFIASFASLSTLRGFRSSSTAFHKANHMVKYVIMISVDTLRADFISYYSNQHVPTPHIDDLAKDGIVFLNAISPSPWTLPSIASIMTGCSVNVHMTAKRTSKLPNRVRTLAEYMRDDGYFTSAIVHNHYLKKLYNVSQGFFEYNAFPKCFGNFFSMKFLKKVFRKKYLSEASTADLTNLAIDWIRLNTGNDFFFWIHYLDPHVPYTPPIEFLPQETPPPRIGTSFQRGPGEIRGGYFVPSMSEREWLKELYGAEVRYVDKNIGRLLNALKQLNIYNESLIIFLSDHGEEFWEHGEFEHGHTLYDEVIWVPLILKLPLSALKGRINTIVQSHNILPTILDICKIEYPIDELSVTSLTPLWGLHPEKFDRRPIVSTGLLYYENRESLLFDDFKYIRSLVTGHEELYDRGRDHAEQISVASLHPDKIEIARSILRKQHSEAEKLRKRHHVGQEDNKIELDEKTKQELRSLGYIQ